MNNYKVLLKVQLLSAFRINQILHSRDKREQNNSILVGAAYGILFLLVAFYSIAVAYGCKVMGMTELLPSLTLMVSAMLSVILTFLKTNGILFGMKDYDMVMSLPISVHTLVISRLLTMYFMNLAVSFVTMLPAVIIYGTENGSSPLDWFMMLCSVILGPLFPMVISAVVSTIIMSAALRFRYRNLVTTLLSMGAVLVLVGTSFQAQNMNSVDLAALGKAAARQINAVYPPAALLSNALNHKAVGDFLLFLLLSLGTAGMFVFLLSVSFAKLNTAIFSHHTKSTYHMERMRTVSPFHAIYQKDLKRLFSSSIYLLNTSIGELLLLLLSLSFLFASPRQIEQVLGGYGIIIHFTQSIPLVISLFMVMSCTTCASVSLEGKSRWCLYTAPVDPGTIFRAKIAVNLTLMFPAAGISALLMLIHFRPGPLTSIFFFLTPAAYGLFTAVLGLALDLKYPRYDWSTEYQAVKQGLPVIGTIGMGMLLALIPLVLSFLFPNAALPLCVFFTIIPAGGAWYLYKRITCFFSSNLLQ